MSLTIVIKNHPYNSSDLKKTNPQAVYMFNWCKIYDELATESEFVKEVFKASEYPKELVVYSLYKSKVEGVYEVKNVLLYVMGCREPLTYNASVHSEELEFVKDKLIYNPESMIGL